MRVSRVREYHLQEPKNPRNDMRHMWHRPTSMAHLQQGSSPSPVDLGAGLKFVEKYLKPYLSLSNKGLINLHNMFESFASFKCPSSFCQSSHSVALPPRATQRDLTQGGAQLRNEIHRTVLQAFHQRLKHNKLQVSQAASETKMKKPWRNKNG